MTQTSTPAAGRDTIVVREPRTPTEEETLHRATAQVFGDDSPEEATLAAGAARWRARAEAARAAYPVHLRAAFQGETFAGSDVIYERQLRLGPHGEAHLRTACIAVVLTHPDHRMKGVGSALMRDAVRLARERNFALLLLSGIPNFYHRFGYVDVMERTAHTVAREHVDSLPPDQGVTVRPATEEDVPALLALYERHYGARPGGFVRPVEEQARLVHSPGGEPEYALAEDGEGQPCGYLKLRGTDRSRVAEAGADTWPAASALLRYQARLAGTAVSREVDAPAGGLAADGGTAAAAEGAPAVFTWPVAAGSLTHFLLAEHLPLTGECRSRPRAGWMARPADLPALFSSVAPALDARWRRANENWSGTLILQIEGDSATDQAPAACTLDLSPGSLALRQHRAGTSSGAAGARTPNAGTVVRLQPGAFTQLLFGFRPVWWITSQPGNLVPPGASHILETLFPIEPIQIVATDGF